MDGLGILDGTGIQGSKVVLVRVDSGKKSGECCKQNSDRRGLYNDGGIVELAPLEVYQCNVVFHAPGNAIAGGNDKAHVVDEIAVVMGM